MKSEPNKSLELSPKVSSISIGLSLLWFYRSDSAAQLNSMLCGPGVLKMSLVGRLPRF